MAGRVGAAAVAAALVAAACADEITFDTASLESGLPAAILPEQPDAITEVVCPEPELDGVARSITCAAILDGDPITIVVEVDDDGLVDATVSEPLLDLTAVEMELAVRIETDLLASGASGVEVDVECPGTAVVIAVGRTVDCSGGPIDAPRPLEVTIVSDDGTWEVGFGG